MSSKYNTGVPIDLDSLDESELAQAFHEWAEGSKALEDLFYACHENGIKTWASDAHTVSSYFTNRELGIEDGDPDAIVEYPAMPYISFVLDDQSENYMSSIYEIMKSRKDVEMMMQLSSTEDPPSMFNIYTNPDNRDEIFSLLSENIREIKLKTVISPQFKKMKSIANIYKDVWYVQPEVISATKTDELFMKLRVFKYKIMQKFREKISKLFSRKNNLALPEPIGRVEENADTEGRTEEADKSDSKAASWELSPEEKKKFDDRVANMHDIQETEELTKSNQTKTNDIEDDFHGGK